MTRVLKSKFIGGGPVTAVVIRPSHHEEFDMFGSAIAINLFQSNLLTRIASDIDDSILYEPAAGHGHTPIWIMGHLAITGELGQRLLGGRMSHPNWLRLFGPGSTDDPALLLDDGRRFAASDLLKTIEEAYAELRRLASEFDDNEVGNKPHGIDLFADTPITTVADAVTLLLTNHFGFHLSQLSTIRRAQGHSALF
jgi:hypothetical protein